MTAGREVIYEGIDGRRWHLHGRSMGDEGVYLTSMAGIYHPVRVPLDTRPAYMAGARPGLPKTDPRVMDLKIFTTAESAEEWEEIENDWWDSWSDEEDGLLIVESRRGTYRDIPLRLQRYPSEPFDFEPDDVFDWTLPTIAYQPWWRGPELTSEWDNSNGTGTGTLRLANPGDVEIWPQYMLENIASAAAKYTLPDGVDGDTVQVVGFDPAEGDVLVDTDQLRLQLESAADTQIPARMAALRFRKPLPPRTRRTTVNVSVTGGTTAAHVKAYMRPYYKRPW